MLNAIQFTATLMLALVVSITHAEDGKDWTSWRGVHGLGSMPNGDVANRFDAEHNKWRVELPGKGCSTPIVVGRSIFLTAPIEDQDGVLSYDLQGAEQWRTKFGPQNAGKHRNGSGSNASPVTDGKGIFVYFKSGTLAALELDGRVRWQTNLVERFGKDTLFWDHGTSPVLTDRHVVMARMHQGESWLAAFDKTTGEIAWKVARNYVTPTECDHGYTTPLVIQHAGRQAILLWGAEHVTIHDAADGSVLWSCGNFNPEGNKLWPAIATPVIVGDTVVIAYGRNDRGVPRLHGLRLSGSGDVTATNHAWKRDDVGTFVPTPAVHRGTLVLVRDRGEVDCLDPATGKSIWNAEFPKARTNFYSSPLIVGDKLIAPREDGVVFVASLANGKFVELAQNNMGESIIGSPVPFSEGILLRGERHLFCIAGRSDNSSTPRQ